jgi:N-acetylglucosamine malate deacetylase 1
MNLDVLVFAAHPDDAELSMGGTIARFVDNGFKVGIIDLTKGEMSTRGNTKIRAKETVAASKALKLKMRENLELPDGGISISPKSLKSVVTHLRNTKPKIVFAPYFNDRHPDHIDASALIKRAVFKSGLEKFSTSYNGKSQRPFRPNKIFYYMQTYLFIPSMIVDISNYFETKMKAVLSFKSQFHNPELKRNETFISRPEFIDYIEARARFYGFQIGKIYGEPFYCEEAIEYDFLNIL